MAKMNEGTLANTKLVRLFTSICKHKPCALALALCVIKLNIDHDYDQYVSFLCSTCHTKYRETLQGEAAKKLSLKFLENLVQYGTLYTYSKKFVVHFAFLMQTVLVGHCASHSHQPPHPGCIPLWQHESLLNTLIGCFKLFGYSSDKATKSANLILEMHETTEPEKKAIATPHSTISLRPVNPMPLSCHSVVATPTPVRLVSPLLVSV